MIITHLQMTRMTQTSKSNEGIDDNKHDLNLKNLKLRVKKKKKAMITHLRMVRTLRKTETASQEK